MTLTWWASLSRRGWRWKPWHRYDRWQVKTGHVWYLNAEWLCFGLQVDNESVVN